MVKHAGVDLSNNWTADQLAKQYAADARKLPGSKDAVSSDRLTSMYDRIPGGLPVVQSTEHFARTGTTKITVLGGDVYTFDIYGNMAVDKADVNALSIEAIGQMLPSNQSLTTEASTRAPIHTSTQQTFYEPTSVVRDGVRRVTKRPAGRAGRTTPPGQPSERVAPVRDTVSASANILMGTKKENYPGQKLVEGFPKLFDKTASEPISLAQAGLCVVAVKLDNPRQQVEGMPEYASFLGHTKIDGTDSVAALFVMAADLSERSTLAKKMKNVHDICVEDGVYAMEHSAGVSLYGPAMSFVNTLNSDDQTTVDRKHGSEFRPQMTALYSYKRPLIDLSKERQGVSRNLDVMNLNTAPSGRAFVASITLSPEFGTDANDMVMWQNIIADFIRFAEMNSCIPLINGRTFTAITNLQDPTALERPEDVSLVLGSMTAMLRAKHKDNPRVNFDARMFQAEAEVSITNAASFVTTSWTREAEKMGPLRFDGKMYVDERINEFSGGDKRARFVKMETQPAGEGLFTVQKLTLIRDRVEAGQVFEFVGRKAELAALEAALQASEDSLSTGYFQGPTGAGKTAVVLRVAATQEDISPTDRIVLAFKNKDNLDALRDLAQGLVNAIGADVPNGLQGASVQLLNRYLNGRRDPNYVYNEAEMIAALTDAFKILSASLESKKGKFILVLDDFDAAGLKMQAVLQGLMESLKLNKEVLKRISIFGTVRSGQDHAVSEVSRVYVDAMKDLLGEKIEVAEFVLRNSEGEYADWLEEFLLKRCFAPNVPNGARISTAILTQIGELCAMMSSEGGAVHDTATKVPAHTLRIIVDSLLAKNYLTLNGKTGVIGCPRFAQAKQAIERGELPRGPESIYTSQLSRAKNDIPKITLLYFADILSGVDYRVLEDPQVAGFLNSQLFPGDDGRFADQLDKMRMRVDRPSFDEAILSADTNMSMHNLWARELQKDMEAETFQRSPLNIQLRKAALDALIMAKANPALAQHVKAVMIFDLAKGLGDKNLAKEWALNAADEATNEHDYAKVIECAEYAYAEYEGDTNNQAKAGFYLAKAYLFSHDKEKGKEHLLSLARKQLIDHLPLAMRFEFVEVQLELYRQEFIEKELHRNQDGMKEAIKNWANVIRGMTMFVERKFADDMGVDAVEAGERAKLMIGHSELEHQYKSVVMEIQKIDDETSEVDKKHQIDVRFKELIGASEGFLASLKRAQPSEKIDIMIAKVSQTLAALIHQRWRQCVDFDEVIIAQQIQVDDQLKADMFRIIELCNTTLLIARQRRSLSGDYAVEARAATARFTAGAFLNLPRPQQAYFISIAVQYMANVSASDAETSMINMYCGASANLSRADMPEDVFSELLAFATEIARIQRPEGQDSTRIYGYYNYVESKLFQAVGMEHADAEKELRETYDVLDQLLFLAKKLDVDNKLLVLALVSRHLALCEAKDVSITQEGVPFNHIGLIRERMPDFRELIMKANERFDGLESQGDDSIQLNLYNGVDDFDASQISSIHDLIVKYGAKSAFELLLTRDVQAE